MQLDIFDFRDVTKREARQFTETDERMLFSPIFAIGEVAPNVKHNLQ